MLAIDARPMLQFRLQSLCHKYSRILVTGKTDFTTNERRTPMRWKQFLTPVKSIDTRSRPASMLDEKPGRGNDRFWMCGNPMNMKPAIIPGAKLIPLPDLGDR
jgi:hypothetical protein